MEILEVMKARHSVRQYKNQPIGSDVLDKLKAEINTCNSESGLHIQLVVNDPKVFDSMMAHYGKFSGVQNYIALVGKKGASLEESCGYYGERLVLKAQELGLNTCWVAMTFGKSAAKKKITFGAGEKLACVVSLGYGETQGVAHKSKEMSFLCSVGGTMPGWFRDGMEAAMLAPTAMNQQKFRITLGGGNMVSVKNLGGFYSQIDLGIVKCHFELGAGQENFKWA